MEFRTEYKAAKSAITLSPETPAVMLGSCFTENIAKRMRRCMWDAFNPAGTLFNPISICKALDVLVLDPQDGESRFKKSLFTDNGTVHSWLFDSKMSGRTKAECCKKFQKASMDLDEALEEAQVLFLTFGTAWVYSYSELGQPVGNCHKQPSMLFDRVLWNADRIVEYCSEVLEDLNVLYPDLEVVFTVSPVRHVKEGLHENMLSKAILLQAVDTLCRDLDFCSYFPAFEIMIDDLRDYRFYADDLVHPSDMAVDYIWEKFKETYLNEKGKKILQEGERLAAGFNHRPIIPGTKEELKRMERLKADLNKFLEKHPLMKLEADHFNAGE